MAIDVLGADVQKMIPLTASEYIGIVLLFCIQIVLTMTRKPCSIKMGMAMEHNFAKMAPQKE